MTAPAIALVQALDAELGDGAPLMLETLLGQLSVLELAALAYDFEGFWARDEQRAFGGEWSSVGFLTSRRWGKTFTIANHVVAEAMAGRAMRIGLCAQNEERTIAVMVNGQSGLLAVSPPWFKARWEPGSKRVVFPNGAQAAAFSPLEPEAIRGDEYSLFWASELQSWPQSTREDALMNAILATTQGYARLVWDATPKRRHPLIRDQIEKATHDPKNHRLVRGTIYENLALSPSTIQEFEKRYGGTQRGREELMGEFLDDDAGALFKEEWIEKARRVLPTVLKRRILSIDPALSNRKGTDRTGFVELALGVDDQVFVIDDKTDRYRWEDWGDRAIKMYAAGRCDCIVVERSAGYDAVVANLRARGERTGIAVEVVEKGAPTRHVAGVIYVKEIIAHRQKDVRAEPVASAYEAGRVSHVKGAKLDELEDVMTTWEPGGPSPDALDALVHGVWELAKLGDKEVHQQYDAKQMRDLAARVAADTGSRRPTSATMALSSRSLGGRGGGIGGWGSKL